MASYVRQRAPGWYWVVALVIALWGAIGCFACYVQLSMGEAELSALDPYDRRLYAGLPGWYDWVYAIAVGTALAGGIALLVKRALAQILFMISAAAVVIQFGYMFLFTDILMVRGIMSALFPIAILVAAIAALWFSHYATRHGWIH